MTKRVSRRKLGALDFAVAELLARLTILFAGKVRGWDVANGADYEFEGRLGADDDLNVRIRPGGWPKESAISCRFMKGRHLHFGPSGGWSPVSGTVTAWHYPEMQHIFSFRVEPGYRFRPADVGTPGARFFTEALRDQEK